MSEPTPQEVNEKFLDFLMGNSKKKEEAADAASDYIRSKLQDELFLSNILPPEISERLLSDPKPIKERLSYIFNE